ncbi:hypothetical protein REJ49_000805 [Citrobacter farmeri]|nr:hypothetical protein [Citrobacter farmeri]
MSDSEGTMKVDASGGGNYGQPVGGNENNGGHNGSGGNSSSYRRNAIKRIQLDGSCVPVFLYTDRFSMVPKND